MEDKVYQLLHASPKGSCEIKKVQILSNPIPQPQRIAGPMITPWCPNLHIGIRDSKTPDRLTLGIDMIDTGAALSLVTQEFTKVHNLQVRPEQDPFPVKNASGGDCEVIGRTDFTMVLGRDLELTLVDVTVHRATFYQALVGRDILKGKENKLSSAEIKCASDHHPGSLTWTTMENNRNKK